VPPGWNASPWEPGQLRYWDGTAWTAGAATIGPAPARSRTGLIVAAAATIALTIVAVTVIAMAARGGSPQPPGRGGDGAPLAPSVSSPTPKPGSAAVSASQLAAALPRASDVGSGWIVDSTGEPLPGSPKDWGPCASPLWGADLTGTAAWLTYELNAGGNGAHGELGTTIFEAGSQGAADQQRAFLASPADIDCEKSFVNSDTADRWPIANTPNVGAWAVAPDPVELRLPDDARLLTLTQPTIDTTITIYYVLAHQFSGPYEASTLGPGAHASPFRPPMCRARSARSPLDCRRSPSPKPQLRCHRPPPPCFQPARSQQ
jgi:hypothetical protein